jgi:hypothetical protein
MKLSSIGLGFCAIGALLYIVNYCVAVSFFPHITSWPTGRGRLYAAYCEVGCQPTVIGAILFVVGLVLIIIGCRRNHTDI